MDGKIIGGRAQVVELLGGEWCVTVDGVQHGGDRDDAGAGNLTFPDPGAAEAYAREIMGLPTRERRGEPALRTWGEGRLGAAIGTSRENVCARMVGDCAGRRELAEEIVRRFNDHRALVEALRPFANFACDEPHEGEPDCYNCAARKLVDRADRRAGASR